MYIRDSQITVLMAKSHAKLNLTINKIVGGVNMTQKARVVLFAEFQKDILKHFWIEEKSIFGLVDHDPKITEAVRELYKDHIKIVLIISEIEKELTTGASGKLGDFIEIMREHTRMENEIFYPYLDMKLSPENREEVLNIIKNDL